jgi:Rad51 protein
MGSRNIIEPLQPKIWQLDQDRSSAQGYLYSCSLCDEALVLSKLFINPRRVQLVFLDTCPGCGFELEKTLKVQPSSLPPGKRFLTNMICRNAEELFAPDEPLEAKLSRGSTLLRDVRSDLAAGIGLLDRALALRFGQLVSLQGEASNALSHLFCVRAINPLPPGLDSDVVFVDGGNVFDAYTVSKHAFSLGLDQERTKLRIHLSRAFTHHQLSSLITDELAQAIGQCDARLAIVSDITALYCDPDVKEKREAFDLFARNIRSLASLAEQQNMIIVITNLQSRNKTMDNALAQTAHVSATLHDKGAFTQVHVTRHPFIQEAKMEIVTLDDKTLARYLQG